MTLIFSCERINSVEEEKKKKQANTCATHLKTATGLCKNHASDVFSVATYLQGFLVLIHEGGWRKTQELLLETKPRGSAASSALAQV